MDVCRKDGFLMTIERVEKFLLKRKIQKDDNGGEW